MSDRYELTLGLPHTNRRGLSEPHLMKHAGHFYWQTIASALGRPLSDLRTAAGHEVYAAFYYIDTLVPDAVPIETYQVDDTVRFDISLRAFKNLSLEGRVRVGRAAADAPGPEIQFANIFITRFKGNSLLKVAPPEGVDWSHITPLPNDQNPFHATRRAKDDGTLGLFPEPWQSVEEDGVHQYQIDRDRDTNGAGLVYFANYVAFTDAAERVLARSRSGLPALTSVRHRKTAYYGNADIDDQLAIRSTVFRNPQLPRRIGYRHVVSRQSDGALICLSEVIKAIDPGAAAF